MRTMKSVAAIAAVLLLGACSDSPTEPEFVSREAAIESALWGGGETVSDFTAQPAILARLTHAALLTIRQHHGAEAARAALEDLHPWFQDLREAIDSGDGARVQVALAALRQAEAAFIVNTLGADVVLRALAFADGRLDRLDQVVENGTAGGRDPARLQALAARLRVTLDGAVAAEAAGDHATALIGAADVIGALHFLWLQGRCPLHCR